jgi:hypothetical protein
MSMSSSLTPSSRSAPIPPTETVLRNLFRDGTTSSLSVRTVRAVQDDLRVNGDGFTWTLDLARGLGRLVMNHSSALQMTEYDIHDNSDGSNSSDNNRMDPRTASVPSEATFSITAKLLSILSNAMDRWEDHIIYAVLIEEHSSDNTGSKMKQSFNKTSKDNASNSNKKQLSRRQTLLGLLTSLSVISIDNTTTIGPSTKSLRTEIRRYAINGLATAWRCLDHLQDGTTLIDSIVDKTFFTEVCSTNSPWWVDEDDARSLGVSSFNALLDRTSSVSSSKHQSDEFSFRQQPSFSDDTDDRKGQCTFASLSIVASLLRHGLMDWALSSGAGTGGATVTDRELADIASNLIENIQLLHGPVLLPVSSQYSVAVALMSTLVLSLLQMWMGNRMQSATLTPDLMMFQRLTQTVHSAALVENIVHFALLSPTQQDSSKSSPPAPSHIRNYCQQRLHQELGLYLFSCWKLCGESSVRDVFDSLGSKLNRAAEEFWIDLLTQEEGTPGGFESRLTSFIWLHRHHRVDARRSVVIAMQKTAPESVNDPDDGFTDAICQKLLQKLFGSLRSTSGASYTCRMKTAQLLEQLLTDNRNVATHDELSRGLWRVVGDEMLEGLKEVVLEHASTEDSNQPLLLCFLDLLTTLLDCNTCCNHLLGTLGAHNVETLIYLVKPLDVRYDFMQDYGLCSANDMNSDTPPLHNLSRLDEASICMEHEDVKEPRGLDISVRLSAATVLAKLAYGCSIAAPEESIGILTSRIATAVNDFLSDPHQMNMHWNDADGIDTHPASLDECRRACRLKRAVYVPQNEEFLVTMIFTSQAMQQHKFKVLADENTTLHKDLAMVLERERMAKEDKDVLMRQMKSHALVFQREISRMKLNMGQEARQLISVHALERAKAEQRAQRFVQEAERATVELQATKEGAQQMKNVIERTEDELEQAVSKVNDLQIVNEDLQRQIHIEKSTVRDLLSEVDAHRDEIRSYVVRFDELQNHLEVNEKIVATTEAVKNNLHENLEDLFADMVSITQMYQHNESQHASEKKKFEASVSDVTVRLQLEKERNDELGKTIHDLQEENEKLYRKLGKYKERLELERKDRLEADERRRKRNGPVSYFNSLHDTTTSDRSISQNQKQLQQSSRDQNTSQQRKAREVQSDKENSSASNYYSTVSQRRNHY